MVSLVPWGPDDLPLLEALLGDPAMTEHLGGPESPEELRDRQARYESMPVDGPGRTLRVVDDGESVGWVGFWEIAWQGEQVYEFGWSVLPHRQGRGVASAATRQALEMAAAMDRHRWAHAFPIPANDASNAICRKLGWELLGVVDYDYKGSVEPTNDWRFDLHELHPALRRDVS